MQRFAVAQRQNAVVQRLVAHQSGHVLGVQQVRADGRQDSHRCQPAAQFGGAAATGIPGGGEFVLNAREDFAVQRRRAAVQLDVEGGQFGHHQRVVDGFQQLAVVRMRLTVGIDDPRLQLEADDVAAVAEAVFLEQRAHQRRLRVQPPPKAAEVLGVEVPLANLFPHRTP